MQLETRRQKSNRGIQGTNGFSPNLMIQIGKAVASVWFGIITKQAYFTQAQVKVAGEREKHRTPTTHILKEDRHRNGRHDMIICIGRG